MSVAAPFVALVQRTRDAADAFACASPVNKRDAARRLIALMDVVHCHDLDVDDYTTERLIEACDLMHALATRKTT